MRVETQGTHDKSNVMACSLELYDGTCKNIITWYTTMIIVTMLLWSGYAYCMETRLSGEINVTLHIHLI